jgi:hypothetical protein
MSMKRTVGAAAVAAALGFSALTLNAGFANSTPPLDPTQPPCPNCHGGNPGGSHAPESPPPQQTTPAPTQQTTEAPRSTAAPTTHSSAPPTTQTTAPHTTAPQTTTPPPTHSSVAPTSTQSGPPRTTPSGSQTTGPRGTGSTERPTGQTTPPAGQSTTPPGGKSPSGTRATPALVAPSTQPPHPAFVPHGNLKANEQVGGPTDINVNFTIVNQGAPTPPPQRGHGWNDGRAPGRQPPNWFGPPPQGGWDAGQPPPGGWNRPWENRPPRDMAVARVDFGPFALDTFTVIPVFNWQFGGWGYWYFGLWIPLF